MEGLTHPALRHIMAERGGIGVVCTEFVRITKAPLSSKILRRHVAAAPGAALSVQVMGNDLDNMAEATELVTSAGADIVDINLGCPAPNAVRKGVGSAMLADRRLLGQVVSAMRGRTHLPLSAKIRAGLDDSAGVLDVAKTVQDSGADFITVHPRRRTDFYRGVADWRIIELLSRELDIPVVGNGDAWYASDALRMQAETGCRAVMMGRPALRNPWIFVQVQALRAGRPALCPGGRDLVFHVTALAQQCAERFSELGVLGQLKEGARYYARAVLEPSARGGLREVLRQPTVQGFLGALQEWLGPLDAEDLDLAAEGGVLESPGRVDPLRDIA
jgi:tRNA-dihydrouridine synthase B